MKKKILVKLFSVFFALGLIKNSIVLAKEEEKKQQQNVEQPKEQPKEQPPKEQQQEKKLSPEEEKQKQKQQDIKTIKEVKEKLKSLEEQMQKKMLNMFKNFKKEDYEVKNYDLEVFKKANAKILVYTHKKTGAQVFFNLNLDKEKMKENTDDLLVFRAPTKDERGLVHFAEHCLASNLNYYFVRKLKITGDEINAFTSPENLTFVAATKTFGLNEKIEEEYVEKLSNELRNPTVFEKGSKIFETEKKRILNEIKDKKGLSCDEIAFREFNSLRRYKPIGEISSVEKATLKDLEKLYKKYINPSNCLIIKNVLELNPKKIKKYLNMWHENYFGHYNKEKTTGNDFELKNKAKYLFKSWPKDSRVFNAYDKEDKKQNFKFKAIMSFNLDKIDLKQQQSLNLTLEPFKDEIEKLAKDLGYDRVKFGGGIQFFGNKKELFSQKALEENFKKIMSFVENKLKGLNEEDFFYLMNYGLKSFNKFELEKLNLNTALNSSPQFYNGVPFNFVVLKSFNETKKAISKEKFIINDKNEIEANSENLKNYVKKNVDVYGKLAQIGPKYIDVFEKSNLTLKQTYKKEYEKYKLTTRVLPVKLKEKNLKNPFVVDFAKLLLNKALTTELSEKKGLLYGDFYFKKAAENNFSGRFRTNKESVKPLEDHIFKNFDEIMKNVELKENDLKELKKQYKENFNSFKKEYEEDFLKEKQKIIKDFESYIKTGKIDKNSVLKEEDKILSLIFKFDNSNLIYKLQEELFTLTTNFKENKALFEKEMSFKEKYIKKIKEKINPEFVKDLLQNLLIPFYKVIKKGYKLAEKKLKAIDSIKFLDVKNLIKTAYLVKDKEEIKKVNKNIENGELRIEKLNEEFVKS